MDSGLSGCLAVEALISAIVGDSNTLRSATSIPKAPRIRLTNLVASNECPPMAKKSSCTLTLIPIQYFRKQATQYFFLAIARACIAFSFTPFSLRSRQCFAIDFAVWRQRQLVHLHKSRWNHVFRQSLFEELPESLRLHCAIRDHICHDSFFCGLIFPNDHGTRPDSRMCLQSRFNLAQFDTVAPHLHLLVHLGPGIPDSRPAPISPGPRCCISSLLRVQRRDWERIFPLSTLAGLNIRARLPGLPKTTRRSRPQVRADILDPVRKLAYC